MTSGGWKHHVCTLRWDLRALANRMRVDKKVTWVHDYWRICCWDIHIDLGWFCCNQTNSTKKHVSLPFIYSIVWKWSKDRWISELRMTYLDILEDSDRYLMFDFDWVWHVSLAWICTRHPRDEDWVAPNLDARMRLLLKKSIFNHEIVGKIYEDLFPLPLAPAFRSVPPLWWSSRLKCKDHW